MVSIIHTKGLSEKTTGVSSDSFIGWPHTDFKGYVTYERLWKSGRMKSSSLNK